MLSLDDPKWSELDGGFRLPYDASAPLKRLEAGEDAWEELTQELHNEGDVGEASYAAVPHLVRIAKSLSARGPAFYQLLTKIEIERHRASNPKIPDWLAEDYNTALRELLDVAFADLATTDDAKTIRSVLAAMAVAKGQLKYGALLNQDETEINQMLESFDAWAELLRLTNAAGEEASATSGESEADAANEESDASSADENSDEPSAAGEASTSRA